MYLLDHRKIPLELRTARDYRILKKFWLRDYGHITGGVIKGTRVQYFQAYETISHQVSDKKFIYDPMCHCLTNGYFGEWFKYKKIKAQTELAFQECVSYYKSILCQADLRFEVVVNFIDPLTEVSVKTHPSDEPWYVQHEIGESWVCELPSILKLLAENQCILVFHEFSSFVQFHTNKDLQLLTAVFGSSRNAPHKLLLSAVYLAWQRLVSFKESMTNRFDVHALSLVTFRKAGEL